MADRVSLQDSTEFPLVWDNTMLADASDCEWKAKYRFFHHLKPDQNNVNLHAGAAFAKGIETFRRLHFTGRQPQARIGAAKELITAYGDFDPGDSAKSAERMLGALESYLTQYTPENDHIKPVMLNGEPCVEFNFAHPIDVLHPVTGEQLIYTGRFDMLGILNDNPASMFVVDEKTTKQLGATWPRQWRLRSQFMGYTWGAQQFGHPVKGAIVRGISILKGSYGHAEAIVYFSDEMLRRWYQQTCIKLERLKLAWQTGKWTYNFSTMCSAYGGCPYRELCESDNPDQWIYPYYRVEKWDPMRLRETSE